MPRALHLLPSCLLLALASASAVRADGVPVTPLPAEAEARPHVGSDGRGGAMISYKTESLRLGCVHVNRSGVPDGGFALAPLIPPFVIEANEPLRAVVPSDSQIVFLSDRATPPSPPASRSRPRRRRSWRRIWRRRRRREANSPEASKRLPAFGGLNSQR